MGAVMDRRSWDDGSAESAMENFNRVASALESLISQRDDDVRRAMADYQADGVSDEYHGKEQRWHQVAGEVRVIIHSLRSSLEQSRDIASSTSLNAARAVADIG
ncbi:MAG: hypothetical protein FWG15_08815 [Propionibacteriaceae bacterium]|jgi:uncharacterized protein YukE|nr:hypothetical protein [Propionibacteriaceae bacterium]